MSSVLYRLGLFVTAHTRRVQALWLVLLLGLGAAAATLGTGTSDDFRIPGTQSQTALDQLAVRFPELSGIGAQVVIVAPDGTAISDPAIKALAQQLVTNFEAIDHVVAASNPFTNDAVGGLSKDGQAAIVNVQLDVDRNGLTKELKAQLTRAADIATPTGVQLALGGQAFGVEPPALSPVELAGVLLALIVLVLMFGSILLAGLPLLTAIVGVGVTMSVIVAATGFIKLSSTSPLLALMIGLAVGIDYALLILARYRDNLHKDETPQEAAARAVATAGSAVFFAGLTVAIALGALTISRIPFLGIMGLAATGAVFVAVATVLTLLPTLMIKPWAVRALMRKKVRPESSLGGRWVNLVTRYPVIVLIAVVAGLGAMALPARDMTLALPDSGSAAKGTPQRTAYDLIGEHFGPGYNTPLLVTAEIVTSTDPLGLVSDLKSKVSKLPGVQEVLLATPNRNADTAVLILVPTASSADKQTHDLVRELRKLRIGPDSDIPVQVTGQTGIEIDVSDRLAGALLPFGLVVIGLSLLILLFIFRSIAVPITATLGYLFSIGASFGAVTAVFTQGQLAGLFGVDQAGPLISFLPIILMGILFGLAMDYQVFLVSRIHEEYAHTKQADYAIVHGFASVAPVITAAAAIMIGVFGFFINSGDTAIKPVALGLAVGVFVDAFIVRLTLMPALLKLLGTAAWRLPNWLDRRLPDLDVEGQALEARLDAEQATGGVSAIPMRRRGLGRVTSGEWRNLVNGPLGWKSVVALALIPLLFGATLIWANWDPIGRMNQVQAAVVNLDKPVEVKTSDGKTQLVPLGRQLVAQLVSSSDTPNFDWYLTDTNDAKSGLESGKFAAVLTIPAGFSAAATSSSDAETAKQAKLDVQTNDANNYVVDSITRSITTAATQTLGSELTKNFLTQALTGVGQLGQGIGDAADGATQLSNGSSDLATGLTKLSSGVGDLPSGTKKLNSGAKALADGVGQLDTGIAKLSTGLTQLQKQTTNLPKNVQSLADGVSGVADGLGAIKTQIGGLSTGVSTYTNSVSDLAAICESHGGDATLCGGLSTLASEGAGLRTGSSEIAGGIRELSAGADPLAAGLQTLADGLPALVGGISQSATGAAELAKGSTALAKGATNLSTGTAKLAKGMPALADGVAAAATGSTKLADGATQLADGLDTAREQVPSYSSAQAEKLSKVVADPVKAQVSRIHAQPNFGHGLAPLFVSIALWVAAMGLFLLLRSSAPRRKGESALRAAVAAFLPAAAIMAIGASLLAVILIFGFGMSVASPMVLWGLIGLTGLSFVAINQGLLSAFGVAGRYVGLLLIALQLAAAGAVYPIATAPGFVQAMHSWLPMSYSVGGVRTALAGGSNGLPVAILMLVMWLLVGLVLSVIGAARTQQQESG